MKIAVGSKNPVKVEAVRLAFTAVWPEKEWEVVGIDVDSEVSNQPMSIGESITGARNRAKKALKALDADFGVGIEGGIYKAGGVYLDGGWMVIFDRQMRESIGASVQIPTPPAMMKLINEGKELGEACDIIFKKKNTKQSSGHFGLMTNDLITRTDGYKDGLIMALSRFVHPHLFET